MSVTPALQELRRDRQMPPLGHPGRADGPGVPQHHHRVGVDLERRVVDACGEVVDVLEDDRAALVREQRAGRPPRPSSRRRPGRACRAGRRGSRPRRAGSPAAGSRPRRRSPRPAMFSPMVRPETVIASRCSRSAIWPSRPGRPAGVVEVLHQVRPAGFRSTSHGVDARELVEALERQRRRRPGPRRRGGGGSRWSSPEIACSDADRVLERRRA